MLASLALVLACLQAAAAQAPEPDPRLRDPLVRDEVFVTFRPGSGVGTASTQGMAGASATIPLASGGSAVTVPLAAGETIEAAIARLSKVSGVSRVIPNLWVTSTPDAAAPVVASVASDASQQQQQLFGEPQTPRFPFDWPLSDGLMGGGAWAMERISVGYAWGAKFVGSRAIKICIVDSGIDLRHPDLVDTSTTVTNVRGISFIDNVRSEGLAAAQDQSGHGTRIAGVIAALRNNRGIAGIMHGGVSLHVCRFIKADGYGKTNDAYLCLEWCQAQGAKISVNSWGVNIGSIKWDDGKPPSDADLHAKAFLSIREALNAWGSSHLFVTSAGNQGRQLVPQATTASAFYWMPAQLGAKNILVVAATDEKDGLWIATDGGSNTATDGDGARGSNWGSDWVNVAAPGFRVLSTRMLTREEAAGSIDSRFQYQEVSGTSIAAALAAGAAGLIWSVDDSPSTIDMLLVKEALVVGADVLPALQGQMAGGRRLNVYNALAYYFTLDVLPPALCGIRPGDSFASRGPPPPSTAPRRSPPTNSAGMTPPSPRPPPLRPPPPLPRPPRPPPPSPRPARPPPRPRPPPPSPKPPPPRPPPPRPPPPSRPPPLPPASPPAPRPPPPSPAPPTICGFAQYWDPNARRCLSCTLFRTNCLECNSAQKCIRTCAGTTACKPAAPPPIQRPPRRLQ